MKNVYSGPKNDRYNIDPLDLYRADRTISQRGLGIVGVYHSHPDYPATLSQFDLEHSFPWYSYVVISVPHGKAQETRAWIPNEDHKSVSEETIDVVEGER
jgi:proteasome lid subunit RPN8/RPN11